MQKKTGFSRAPEDLAKIPENDYFMKLALGLCKDENVHEKPQQLYNKRFFDTFVRLATLAEPTPPGDGFVPGKKAILTKVSVCTVKAG